MAALLKMSGEPVPGKVFSDRFGISRQIVVRDIGILRQEGLEILSTNRGYYMEKRVCHSCTVKVRHTDSQTEDELLTVVALGGTVVDVAVKHRVYGLLKAPLHISTRLDVERFMKDIRSGKSTPLMNITSGYHYHTIETDSEEELAAIVEALREKNYLAERLYYERLED